MDLKKNTSADNEKLRVPLIIMGFLFVASIILASFTYKVEHIEADRAEIGPSNKKIQTMQKIKPIEKKTPDIKPKIEVTPPPSEEIVVKENEADPPKSEVPVDDPPIVEEEEEEIVATIIEFPDKEAEFPGGAAELHRYIQSHVKYPPTALDMGDQGKVYLSFVVEPDGSISNVKVDKGISRDLNREAQRVVRSMPKWVPGEAGGKRARTRCRLPIVFTIQ